LEADTHTEEHKKDVPAESHPSGTEVKAELSPAIKSEKKLEAEHGAVEHAASTVVVAEGTSHETAPNDQKKSTKSIKPEHSEKKLEPKASEKNASEAAHHEVHPPSTKEPIKKIEAVAE